MDHPETISTNSWLDPDGWPVVSVITATAGAAEGLPRLLASLRQQSVGEGPIEALVVDNNQDPAQSEQLAAMVRQYSGVRLLSQRTPGPGAARNVGAAAARGRVLLFADDDVELPADYVERHLEAHRTPRRCVVAQIEERNSRRWFRTYLSSKGVVHRFPDDQTVDHRQVYGLNTSVDRELFDEVGGFDEAFVRREDGDFGFRLVGAGVEIVLMPGAPVLHHSTFGPVTLVRRSFWNGYYLAMLVAKHPEIADYEKMGNYGWRRVVIAAVAAPPLLVVGLVVFPVTRRLFHKGITALVLVQNARGFRAYRSATVQP
jgi:GT2 family glycosyltransferase